MFTCSICNETFDGIHLNTAYTTQCGHVFHYKCVMTWLARSNTCPHCRSSVLENNLVKLFFQVDPNAQVILDRNINEEINTLNEQLVRIKAREIRNSKSMKSLIADIRRKQSALDLSNNSVAVLKKELDFKEMKILKISKALSLMTLKYKKAEIDKNKFRAEYSLMQSKIKSLNFEVYDLHFLNTTIIDKLQLEIADLKSEKAYSQSRCFNIENINIEQPSTSKMNIESNNAISLKNQTKSKYYYPQLHQSTKKFLLGCVFLFVEVQIQLHDNNICNNSTMSKANIIKHGGLVEQFYSARITHIICVTQKHNLVEQGIKDGKKCVTYYWLTDIISKKSMIPPWLAIHFPIPYNIDNLPCQYFQFSIINFGTNEGHIIKAMIEIVGGSHVIKEVTSRTDIVISLKLEGELVEKALAINKPVVNVQWLNDILFGAKLGIKEPGNSKYQQFDLHNPFLVNYDMVSHLMEAWNTPLSVNKNQEVFDLTSSPDSPTECKRQKNISEYQNMTNLGNEDIADNDVIITYVKNLPLKPCVMFCGFSTEDTEKYKMILLLFGGTVASNFFEATHLVMNKPIPSLEFFGCVSTVKYILNENWLKDSRSHLKLQDEKEYFIEMMHDEHLGLCYIPAILENNNRRLLFKDLSFFVTPGIIYPPSNCLEQIISSAGGTIERTRRSLESIRGFNSYFIISCPEDHYLYNDLLNIDNVVYSPAFLTCSILKQQVQLQKYLLKITALN